jgi:hypothetical protein
MKQPFVVLRSVIRLKKGKSGLSFYIIKFNCLILDYSEIVDYTSFRNKWKEFKEDRRLASFQRA